MKAPELQDVISNSISESYESIFDESTNARSFAKARSRSLPKRSRLAIFAALGLIAVLSAADMTLADETVRVEAGTTTSRKSLKQVDRYDPIKVAHPSIARAWFRENRLYIQGLRPGSTTVTFKGVYRRIIVGSEIREAPKPFFHEIRVEVLAASTDARPAIRNYLVEPGRSKTTKVEYFLGPAFGRAGGKGTEWSAGNPQPSNSPIASASLEYDSKGLPMIRITGRSPGRVTILLSGERRLHNTWQRVTRSIEVVVPRRDTDAGENQNRNGGGRNGDGNPPPDVPPVETVKALESMYENNKFQSDHIGSDEDKRRVIEEFNKIEFLARQILDKERRSPNPREEIVSRLNSLLDKVRRDLKRLKEKQTDSSLAGTWSLFFRGNKIRGGYRIGTRETDPKIKTDLLVSKGTQPWFFASRAGDFFAGYEFANQNELGLGTNMIQLRMRPGSNQLDIWKTMELTSGEFKFTGYSLVRDTR
jgi:hypothetical protein